MLKDATTEKILKVELNREFCDEESTCTFSCLLKRRQIMQLDEIKEVSEEEFRVVVNQSKRRSTPSTFSKIYYSVNKCAMHF